MASTAPPGTPQLDLLFFPHIFDQVFRDAPHDVLVKLRQTCHDLKARVDAHLGHHLMLWERSPLPNALRALDGGALPLLGAGDTAFLSGTQVLDIPGAVDPVTLDKVIRAVGELDVIRTYDRHAMLLPPLRNTQAQTFVRFLNLTPTDRHPCIPIGCRKVVVVVDTSRGGTGEGVLVDFGYMSRGVEEVVVVFTQPMGLASEGATVVSLADTIGCHPWLVYQLLWLARHVPRYIGRLTFVNLASAELNLDDLQTLAGRIGSNRLSFGACLVEDQDPTPEDCYLDNVHFVSMEEYAARVGPKVFALETDSSAFLAYERQFEDARGAETAKL